METIKAIEELFEYTPSEDSYNTYSGYRIITDKQVIYFLIEDQSSCCENWGYFSTPDDTKDFIGASLGTISLVGEALDTKKLNAALKYGLDEGKIMFVNIQTSKGVLQLVAYNAHNGYYGHTARIMSKQLTTEQRL